MAGVKADCFELGHIGRCVYSNNDENESFMYKTAVDVGCTTIVRTTITVIN